MQDRKQYTIEQTKRRIFSDAGWRCQYPGCCEPCTELAHRIGQGDRNVMHVKRMLRERGHDKHVTQQAQAIIHHDLNLAASCRKHNSYFDISNRPEDVKELVDIIIEARRQRESRKGYEAIGKTKVDWYYERHQTFPGDAEGSRGSEPGGRDTGRDGGSGL